MVRSGIDIKIFWERRFGTFRLQNYGAYFIDKTKEFLQDIRTLNLLAGEKGIQPSSVEMEEIRKAANKFYHALTEEDKAFFANCTEKDVVDMYTAYFTAEKTANSLLSSSETELSDAESRVISIEQIVLSSEDAAKELLEKVRERTLPTMQDSIPRIRRFKKDFPSAKRKTSFMKWHFLWKKMRFPILLQRTESFIS